MKNYLDGGEAILEAKPRDSGAFIFHFANFSPSLALPAGAVMGGNPKEKRARERAMYGG